MVTDEQILRLRQALHKGMSLSLAAAKAGMDRKTARTYRQRERLPSEVDMEHTWRTRPDPFDETWPWVLEQLGLNPRLEAKTLFQDLQRQYPGRFADGQLRTLQRRAECGPAREVFFAQVHHPRRLAASDFTHCSDLGVTLAGIPFPHLLYHFVSNYSNWETGTVCFSESYESLSEGLQNALWELGDVPQLHRTDRLTACVQPAVASGDVRAALSGFTESLHPGGAGDPGRQGQRERRRGAETPPLRAGIGPGDDAARQSGLLQPRLLHRLPEGVVRPAQRRAKGPPGRRAGPATSTATTPPGSVQTAVCARGIGQHRAGGRERLLGAEQADRRVGRGATVRRAGRGLLRPEAGGRPAPSARTRQAQDRLPARHRLAGAQAGSVRRLPLSGRPVPQQPLPHGLRPAGGAAAGSGSQRVSANPVPGGTRE